MIELSDDLKHIGSFVGRCFGGLSDEEAEHQISSAVHIPKSIEELDSHVNNIGRIVDNVARRASDFIICAATNIEDSFDTIGRYIAVEHMPPTPCCIMGRSLFYLLQEHLDGNSAHPSSCTYHT
ncbi:hypothetical protein [Candidatus Magnetominusculus xianensis]|uniref:Uncharacterized protein n=1 Tax=Candidatus Magnetominusculus xianensis TaxID=1748249 RepID=A0ABR5SEH3_9BACT|nr:hypothetical protein [Candidatus Magnetominusculus xianensis]KWT82944.1 hypothetical protein ASN18_2305 [Candidatus Magnetominusculus xianensis]MBF0403023.1 hypothetical protein [Nitrospirota bacterium]